MTAAEMPVDAREWLGQPALARLWDAAGRRLEANGLQSRGSLRLREVSPEERDALALLLGRVPGTRGADVLIALDVLDARLRSSAAGRGLVDVLAALDRPVTDRAGAREAGRHVWARVWADTAGDLRGHGLTGADPGTGGWAQVWLDTTRRSGSLGRFEAASAREILRQAVGVLAVLRPSSLWTASGAGGDRPATGRGDLAERVTGSAHGLDEGTLLARLVLRALALAVGADPGEATRDAAARRALWRTCGVVVDEVSSTALTYGLRPLGVGWRERALADRADHAAETHLTLRETRLLSWQVAPGTVVAVCENPRVLEAAADAAAPAALVCTAGNPTTVVLELLGRLATGGAGFAYHGDFDWPGVALANRLIGRFGASPWRMSAADYEAAVATCRDRGSPLLPLAGPPVEACWDPELAVAMRALGVGVHEESVLESLLSDLACWPPDG